jgi:nicotinamide mononucleotide transporter
VLLGIAENPWNWPVGIAFNVVLFIVLWSHGVYALALLQIVYIGISLYGWWNWLHGGEGHKTLPISRTPPRVAIALGVGAVATIFILHAMLARFTSSTVPWLDAITTGLSLAAQYLLSRKMMGTWFVFSVVDVNAIVINVEKRLYPIVALYAFFLALCVFGYIQWSATLRKAKATGQ